MPQFIDYFSYSARKKVRDVFPDRIRYAVHPLDGAICCPLGYALREDRRTWPDGSLPRPMPAAKNAAYLSMPFPLEDEGLIWLSEFDKRTQEFEKFIFHLNEGTGFNISHYF
jgi:hypothetical protein